MPANNKFLYFCQIKFNADESLVIGYNHHLAHCLLELKQAAKKVETKLANEKEINNFHSDFRNRQSIVTKLQTTNANYDRFNKILNEITTMIPEAGTYPVNPSTHWQPLKKQDKSSSYNPPQDDDDYDEALMFKMEY